MNHSGSPSSEKFKRVIDYLQKSQTINGEYYTSNLRLNDKKAACWCFVAPRHTSQMAVAETETYGFELLPHAAYSPDLAPSDFYQDLSELPS